MGVAYLDVRHPYDAGVRPVGHFHRQRLRQRLRPLATPERLISGLESYFHRQMTQTRTLLQVVKQ